MSKRSKRKKRRAIAARRGHSRGRGQRWILLNPPGASGAEMLRRLLGCFSQQALDSLRSHEDYHKVETALNG